MNKLFRVLLNCFAQAAELCHFYVSPYELICRTYNMNLSPTTNYCPTVPLQRQCAGFSSVFCLPAGGSCERAYFCLLCLCTITVLKFFLAFISETFQGFPPCKPCGARAPLTSRKVSELRAISRYVEASHEEPPCEPNTFSPPHSC